MGYTMSFGRKEGNTPFLSVPAAYNLAAEKMEEYYFNYVKYPRKSANQEEQEEVENFYEYVVRQLHRCGECPHVFTRMNYEWERLNSLLDEIGFSESEKEKIFGGILNRIIVLRMIVPKDNQTKKESAKKRQYRYDLICTYIEKIQEQGEMVISGGLNEICNNYKQEVQNKIAETEAVYKAHYRLLPDKRNKDTLYTSRLLIDYFEYKEIQPIPIDIIARILESLFHHPTESIDPDNLARDYRRTKREQNQ